MNAARPLVAGWLVIAAIGIAFAATTRPGQDWGGDFSQYVAHARNLAEGRAYADLGRISDPRARVVGPTAYPPFVPVLLTPFWTWRGLDLEPMKRVLLVTYLLALGVLFALYRRSMPGWVATTSLLVVGSLPALWTLHNRVLSELPFLLHCTAALLLLEPRRDSREAARSAAAGLFVALAASTRPVGLVLLPALVARDLIQQRRVAVGSWIALGVGAAIYLPLTLWLRTESGYVGAWTLGLPPVPRSLLTIGYTLPGTWFAGLGSAAMVVLGAAAASSATVGALARMRERVTILETFGVFYVVVLVAFPAGVSYRYLLPLLVLFPIYAVRGLALLPRRWAALAGALLASATLASSAVQYARFDYGPYRIGPETAQARELFAFITAETADEARFVFRKPRVLALYTERAAASWPCPIDPDGLWDFLARVGADYVVRTPDDPPCTAALDGADPARLVPVFRGGSFELSRLSHGR